MGEPTGLKRCTKCGEFKEPGDFYRDRRRPDGRRGSCKSCENQFSPEQVAKRRVTQRNRRTLNSDNARDRRRRLRAAIFGHYGAACACCGATEDLTIDHLNGQGGGHRTDLFNGRRTGGWHFYRWLAANNFPPGYQVLCRACNNSKFQGERCRLDHGIAA